jgi:hypothetical protein
MKSCEWVSCIINEKCFKYDEFNHWIKSGKWKMIFFSYGWKWMFIKNFIHEREIKYYQNFKIHNGWKFDFHGWNSSVKVELTNDRWISYILDENNVHGWTSFTNNKLNYMNDCNSFFVF